MTALVGSIGGDPRRARISYLEMLGVSDAVEQHRTRRRAQWVEFFENTLRSAERAFKAGTEDEFQDWDAPTVKSPA